MRSSSPFGGSSGSGSAPCGSPTCVWAILDVLPSARYDRSRVGRLLPARDVPERRRRRPIDATVGPSRAKRKADRGSGSVHSLRGRPVRYPAAVTQNPDPKLPADGGDDKSGLVVALDGPSSSGKSTVGAEAARRLGYRFCDTGLLYRAVAWLALDRGVPASDTAALVALAAAVQLRGDEHGRLCHVTADGRDVTALVHGPTVDRAVSEYSMVPELRAALVVRQRELAARGGIIMAGRDIGTVILPDAPVKIYLDASAEERARRRAAERSAADTAEASQILVDLRRRDAIDSGRETAPLRTADDAVLLNTDGRSLDDTVEEVLRIIREGGGHGR